MWPHLREKCCYQSLQNLFSLDKLDLEVSEAFYSLGAKCSSYRVTTISISVERWCPNTALCVGFPRPFPFAIIVKKTYAVKQNHLMIDSKSKEI